MAALWRAAERPIILAGGGARGAATEIRALSERLDAPVVMTINGRGILPSGPPLALNATASHAPVRDLRPRPTGEAGRQGRDPAGGFRRERWTIKGHSGGRHSRLAPTLGARNTRVRAK